MDRPVYRLFRCDNCRHLLTDWHIRKYRMCKICGGRMVRGAVPITIRERLLVLVWSLTLAWRK